MRYPIDPEQVDAAIDALLEHVGFSAALRYADMVDTLRVPGSAPPTGEATWCEVVMRRANAAWMEMVHGD